MCEPQYTLVRECFHYDGVEVMMFGMYQTLDLWMLQDSDAVWKPQIPYNSRMFQCAVISPSEEICWN
jgi:hypothetical protein